MDIKEVIEEYEKLKKDVEEKINSLGLPVGVELTADELKQLGIDKSKIDEKMELDEKLDNIEGSLLKCKNALIDNIHKSIEQADRDIQSKSKSYDDMISNFNALDENVTISTMNLGNTESSEINEKLETLTSKLAEHKQKLADSIGMSINDEQEKLEKNKKKLEEYKKQVEEKNKSKNALQERLKSMDPSEPNYANVQSAITNLDTEIADLTDNKIKSVEDDIVLNENNISDLQTKYKNLTEKEYVKDTPNEQKTEQQQEGEEQKKEKNSKGGNSGPAMANSNEEEKEKKEKGKNNSITRSYDSYEGNVEMYSLFLENMSKPRFWNSKKLNKEAYNFLNQLSEDEKKDLMSVFKSEGLLSMLKVPNKYIFAIQDALKKEQSEINLTKVGGTEKNEEINKLLIDIDVAKENREKNLSGVKFSRLFNKSEVLALAEAHRDVRQASDETEKNNLRNNLQNFVKNNTDIAKDSYDQDGTYKEAIKSIRGKKAFGNKDIGRDTK